MTHTQHMTNSFDRILTWMKNQAPENEAGSLVRLGDQARANQATFHKVLRKGRMTNARDFLGWLDNLGVRIVLPGEDTGYDTPDLDQAGTILARETTPPLGQDEYLSVPLVSMEVAARVGHRPSDKHIKAMLHIWNKMEIIPPDAGLVAVEIGPGQHAMAPLLQPGDFVILDTVHLDIHSPKGNIFLIQEPLSKGSRVAIRRVVLDADQQRTHLAFLCEDPNYPPAIFDLNADYGGDIRAVLKGRVIMSCQDMTHR